MTGGPGHGVSLKPCSKVSYTFRCYWQSWTMCTNWEIFYDHEWLEGRKIKVSKHLYMDETTWSPLGKSQDQTFSMYMQLAHAHTKLTNYQYDNNY